MSQVAEKIDQAVSLDPYEIGWWIESADEEIYGPVARKTVRRFLEEGIITPNTLVRHCCQGEAKPAADQPGILEGISLDGKRAVVGDKLAEAWPRRGRDQRALAEDSLACWRHKRPAVLMCVRCHAPYCDRCRAKPFRKHFFLCRRCQSSLYNRRFAAFIIDDLIFTVPPRLLPFLGLEGGLALAVFYPFLILFIILFMVRDALFRGAGPGKRLFALRVVRSQDGQTPLTYGQGILRWLSLAIPLFNLVDASVPYRDPLLRRFGDRWAGTRVLDTTAKLVKARDKVRLSLMRKGVKPAPEFGLTMEELARLA